MYYLNILATNKESVIKVPYIYNFVIHSMLKIIEIRIADKVNW